MTEHENQEDELVQRVKQGDKDAANELFGKYFDRVSRAARKRLKQRRLRGTDSQDIAASVFESLWKKVDRKQFSENDLTTVDEFWRLLCTMIRFKTEDHVRREHADKRGGGQVRGESIFVRPDGDHVPGLAGQSDGAMTADEMAAFQDHHQMMLELLDDAILQEVVTLRMEDNKVADIAKHFEKSERWVKRKLALIRDIWQRQIDKAEA